MILYHYYFYKQNPDAQIEISIRFNGFTQTIFDKQSFTSNIFQQKYQNKILSLKTTNSIQVNHTFFYSVNNNFLLERIR